MATPRALVLAAVYATRALGDVDGGSFSPDADAPLVRDVVGTGWFLVEEGSRIFNAPAYLSVDEELKRLQAVERAHKGEPPFVVSLMLGVALGALLAAAAVVPLMWWLLR